MQNVIFRFLRPADYHDPMTMATHFMRIVHSSTLLFFLVPQTSTVITEMFAQPSTERPLMMSLYKIHIVRARCQALCVDQCVPLCNITHFNLGHCKDNCTTAQCRDTCDSIKAIVHEESKTQDAVYVKNPYVALNVTTPEAACLYTPTIRDDTNEGSTIVLKWSALDLDGEPPPYKVNFVIEIYEDNLVSGEIKRWTPLGHTQYTIMPIVKLNPSSKFKFRVSAVTAEGLVERPVTSRFIHLPKAVELPEPPRNISVHQFVQDQTLKAEVRWEIPNNFGCYFKLYWMTTSGTTFFYKELREWVQYKYELSNISFDSNYTLEIQTYDRHFRTPSVKVLHAFHTLSCLESTQYSYNSCVPDTPQQFEYRVVASYISNETRMTNVTLSWRPPRHASVTNPVDRYVVTWRKDPDIRYINHIKADRGFVTLPSDVTEYTLADIHWNAEYVVTVAAESKAGSGEKASLKFITGDGYSPLNNDDDDSPVVAAQMMRPTENVYFATIIPAVLAAGSISVCVIYFIKFKKQAQHMTGRNSSRREQAINPLYEYTMGSKQPVDTEPLIITDEFEVDYGCLKLTTVLGEGAFGRVLKAEYTPKGAYQSRQGLTTRIVAVKLLKDHATPEERRFLLLEIGTMKTLGKHPNLVSIVACITNNTRPCLVMDYCPLGDLRNYLRQHRSKVHYMSTTSSGIFSVNMSGTRSFSSESIKGTENLSVNTQDAQGTTCEPGQEVLSQTLLLSYARQIALGMEYLNQNRFIHRDLAARNILMVSPKCVKISDFGLSRDVYETNAYQPTSARKLPFKWMPIESIFDQVFTIKSDVWSYGILLWEIVTLGGCPYPGVPNCDLFRLLSEGYRLERPNNCSTDIYKIMLTCWHPCIDDRPSFTQLKKKIEALLEASCSYIDLSTEVSADYYRSDSSDEEENEFLSGRNLVRKMSVKASRNSHDGSTPVGAQSNQGYRHAKRYSRFDTLSMHEEDISKICPYYPVSKGPFVRETDGPIPGLSEELLHKALSSVDLAKNQQNSTGNLRSEANAQALSQASVVDKNRSSIPTVSQLVESPPGKSLDEKVAQNISQETSPSLHRSTARVERVTKAKTCNVARKVDKFGLEFVYPNVAAPPLCLVGKVPENSKSKTRVSSTDELPDSHGGGNEQSPCVSQKIDQSTAVPLSEELSLADLADSSSMDSDVFSSQ